MRSRIRGEISKSEQITSAMQETTQKLRTERQARRKLEAQLTDMSAELAAKNATVSQFEAMQRTMYERMQGEIQAQLRGRMQEMQSTFETNMMLQVTESVKQTDAAMRTEFEAKEKQSQMAHAEEMVNEIDLFSRLP